MALEAGLPLFLVLTTLSGEDGKGQHNMSST